MDEIRQVLHAGISVYHMEESIQWYERNLGFHLVKDDGFCPPLGARICFLQREDGFQLELFEYEHPKPLPEERLHPDLDLQTVGMKHIAFAVTDMESLKDRLHSNGVEFAHETRMGGDHVLFIRDCSGVLLELIQH